MKVEPQKLRLVQFLNIVILPKLAHWRHKWTHHWPSLSGLFTEKSLLLQSAAASFSFVFILEMFLKVSKRTVRPDLAKFRQSGWNMKYLAKELVFNLYLAIFWANFGQFYVIDLILIVLYGHLVTLEANLFWNSSLPDARFNACKNWYIYPPPLKTGNFWFIWWGTCREIMIDQHA